MTKKIAAKAAPPVDKRPDPTLPLHILVPELEAAEHNTWLDLIRSLGIKPECEMHCDGNTKCRDRNCMILRSMRTYWQAHKKVSEWRRWQLRELKKLAKEKRTTVAALQAANASRR